MSDVQENKRLEEVERIKKERRYLLILSLIIIAHYFSSIEISEFNIFGNKFNVGDPIIIEYLFVAVWFYFLLTYYQSFRFKGKKTFKQAVTERVGRYLKRRVAKIYSRENPDLYKFKVHFDQPGYMEIENYFRARCTISYMQAAEQGWLQENQHEYEFSKKWLVWYYFISIIGTLINSKTFLEDVLPLLIGIVTLGLIIKQYFNL